MILSVFPHTAFADAGAAQTAGETPAHPGGLSASDVGLCDGHHNRFQHGNMRGQGGHCNRSLGQFFRLHDGFMVAALDTDQRFDFNVAGMQTATRNAVRAAFQLRYQLVPYLYTAGRETPGRVRRS